MRLLDAKLSEDGCSTELLSVIKTVLAGCKKISNILSSGDFSYIPLDSFGVQQVNEKEPLNTISNNILKDLLVDLCVVKAVASKEEEQYKLVGKNCLIFSVMNIVLGFIVITVIFA